MQMLADDNFDLVVLDLNLPGADGMTVLRTLRKNDRDTKVLILSARMWQRNVCMDIARVEDQQEFEQSPNAKIAVQYAVAYQYEHREEADHHGVVIPDEFCEGSFCSRLYEEIAKRKKKICEKLQVDEDLDLEHIINCMEDFTRYMSMKMYEYGALMGTKE